MDTITHGLLGATAAQLGFRQKIGRDASWLAFAAATAPDLDFFIAPLLSLSGAEVDEFTMTQVHRGPSHSLLLAPLFVLPIAMGWWYFRRRLTSDNKPQPATDLTTHPEVARHMGTSVGRKRPGFFLLYACLLVAWLTHAPLDYLTAYGTQLFSPLTSTRYSLVAVPIVDIIFTPLLILTLLLCYLVRKARGGRAVRSTLVIGWLGFALAMGYLATGRIMHNRAVDIAKQATGITDVVSAEAYPQIPTIFLWRVVLETEDEWIAVRVHHFRKDPPTPDQISRVRKQPDNQWTRMASELRECEIYDWFAQGRLRTEYRRIEGLHLICIHDMRYSRDSSGVESMWPLRVQFDSDGQLIMAGRM